MIKQSLSPFISSVTAPPGPHQVSPRATIHRMLEEELEEEEEQEKQKNTHQEFAGPVHCFTVTRINIYIYLSLKIILVVYVSALLLGDG